MYKSYIADINPVKRYSEESGVRQRRREVGEDPSLPRREQRQILQLLRLPESALHCFRPAVVIGVAVAPERRRIDEAFPTKHAHLWRLHVSRTSVGALRANLLDEVRGRRRWDGGGGHIERLRKAVLQCLSQLQWLAFFPGQAAVEQTKG